jgi:alpha-L-fucosidase
MHVPIFSRRILPVTVSMLVCLSSRAAVAAPTNTAPANPDPDAGESATQRDARMKWWREARFGMFIHWGVYSVPAGIYSGKPIPGIGEWIMHRGKIPVAEYREYAKQFNPVQFNADDWVRLAKAAGMRYIVITSKHHDGFAMFDSLASDWSIAKATPFGRDPLKELAAACRKHGLKLGFYYSQAQDWNHPGGAAMGGHWDKAQDGNMDDYLRDVAAPQVREILSRYGPVAVLWWDTPVDMTRERAATLLPLLRLQPGIIQNNRLGGGFKGDTETPEQFIPATGYPGRDWETCMTMNDTWGYKSTDHNWKSAGTLIRNLVDIASKGGNYLLNVGPTSEGLIPEPSIERLREIGRWMRVNGEAIYGTAASPFQRLPWGRCTQKALPAASAFRSPKHELEAGDRIRPATILYLHIFNWPEDGRLVVPGLMNEVQVATLLSTGARLATATTTDGVVVQVPTAAPDSISATVLLRIRGTPRIAAVPITQEADGFVRLLASEAVLHGELRYEFGDGKDNIGYWTNPADWASWDFVIDRPGVFQVAVETASLGDGRFEVALGGQSLRGRASNTGDYTRFKRATLSGTLEIAGPGSVTLAVKPISGGWAPLNLKSITLKPTTGRSSP